MKNSIYTTLALACALSAGSLLYGQDAAVEAQQETVSIADPASKPQVPAPQQVQAVEATPSPAASSKIEWKSDEAKRRMASAGQGAASGRAEESQKITVQKDGPPPWRLLVAFVVMGLLLYGLYLFLKKFGKRISGEESSDLKVLSKLRLDSRNSLALIRFHEEELLLSVNAGGGVQLLSKQSQIEMLDAEGSSGKVEENDLDEETPAVIFNGLKGSKESADGIRTVKDGLL